ncbi:hypothetical protein ACF0H5_006108 [Mactra antiquata]
MKLTNGSTTESLATINPAIIESDNDTDKGCFDEIYLEKKQQIEACLSEENVDIDKLREFAISPGGFVTDDLRQRAWPKMVGIDVENIPPKPDEAVLHGHRDYNQVVLDVNRSLKRFPPGMDDNIRLGLQDQLVDLIMRVLVRHDELHYYQGYHDICVTFLLVVGEDVAFALVDKLSMNHLRDFMDANMDRTKHILNYMYPLISRVNPKLTDFLERSEVGTIFSLSWLITWYGHVLPHLRDIVRCYDFFIACHPLMPIYLAAAIVLYREKEILENECDMCILHGLLSKIPDDLPYEQLIVRAGQLYKKFSPDEVAHDAILNFKKSQQLAKARIQNRQKYLKPVKKKRWFPLLYQDGSNIYLKITFWTLTAVISATVIAYLKPSDWDMNIAGWWT